MTLVYHKGRNRGTAVDGKQRLFTPKAPRGVPGSDEAVLYAGNILYDPGFEIYVQNAAPNFLKPAWEEHTGATTYVLPRLDLASPTGQRWPNGDYVDRKDIAQWAQYTEPYEIADDIRQMSAWQVVRREAADLDYTTAKGPKLGVWMARWYDWSSSGNYAFGNSLPGGLIIQGPGMPGGYSGRTENGALITWSSHVWLSESEANQTMDLCIQFYKQDGTPLYSTQDAFTVTTTKTEHTISSNSPGGSYFMRVCITFRVSTNKTAMVQVDTATLGVE